MGKKGIWAIAASLLFSLAATAQDVDPDRIKQAILDKVRAKLAQERTRILHEVAKLIDRELSKGGDPSTLSEEEKKIRELEMKLRQLNEKREEIRAEIEKSKRLAADEPLKREAKKSGPSTPEEAIELFQSGLRDHEDGKFDESVLKFKKIFFNFPKEEFGRNSAYNVACGYALAGRKEYALDWLEVSIANGYNDFEHLRADSDLDSLRKEPRYLRLLTDN